jgi:16S rRNA U1498 N3-methylase RsmE
LLHEAILLDQLLLRHEKLANRLGAVAHCMEGLSTVSPREPWVSWQQGKYAAWIAIGPEGDFSPQEVEWLVEACAATPVHLGNLRLRTETAGMAAIAQFESR